MSDVATDISQKNILFEWLTPAVNKAAAQYEKDQKTLAEKKFDNWDQRQASPEKAAFDKSFALYETLNGARQSMQNRLNVYGYMGRDFMEVVYQGIFTAVNRIPAHYYKSESISSELSDGRLKLFDYYQSYVQNEGNQFLGEKPFNIPEGADPSTFTYKEAFQALQASSGTELKAYKVYENPIRWWAQTPTKKKYVYGAGTVAVTLILTTLYFQWKISNAKK